MSTVRSMHADESHETVQKEPETAPSVGIECNDGENKNKKRKTSRQRSEVWDHFTKISNDKCEQKAKCNYCMKELFADTKLNGTSSLKAHVRSCPNMPRASSDPSQTELLVPSSEGEGSLGCAKYNAEALRNMLLYVATVLDPRRKYVFADFCFKRMYSIDQASVLYSKLREVTGQLFNEYNELLKVSQGDGSNFSQSLSVINEDCDDQPHNILNIETDFQKYLVEIGRGEQKSELDKYINEELDTQTGGGEFDILRWWRENAHRFPVLSCIARDILAILVSTVASESAFSTGGRVLDTYRSSLTPKIVQALVCTQDWLWEENLISMNDLVEHDVGEMYKLDMDMSNMSLDPVID